MAESECSEAVAFSCNRCKKFHPVSSYVRKDGKGNSKMCLTCRQQMQGYHEKWRGTPKGVVSLKKHRDSDLFKETQKRHKSSEKCHQTNAAYRESPRYREVKDAEYERTHSDPGLHLQHGIGVAIVKMMKGQVGDSNRVRNFTEFASPDEVTAHFSGLLEDGMTLFNHGKHGATPERVWNVGHRIARAMYSSTEEDIKRCWRRANLFPQWADQNLSLQVQLPSDTALLELRHCWPLSWNDKLPYARQRSELEARARNWGGSNGL